MKGSFHDHQRRCFKRDRRCLVGAKPKIVEFVNKHLTVEGARIFTPEHTYFAEHFPRWFGNVIGNCPEIEPRAYMIGNMYVEEVDDPTIHDTHHGSMVTFGEGLGMTREQVLNHVPSIPMRMGIHYWDNISRTRPWLEGFAAVGSLELTNHGELASRYGEIALNARKKWEPLGSRFEISGPLGSCRCRRSRRRRACRRDRSHHRQVCQDR